MAKRPRRPITNPYFISLSKQKRLCPWCGRPLRLNGTLDPDAAVEVCDNEGCEYFQGLRAPDWACVDGRQDKQAKPTTPKPRPPHLRLVD